MTQLQTIELLFDKEFDSYIKKSDMNYADPVTLDDLFLSRTSGFELINEIRCIACKNISFLREIAQENKRTKEECQSVLEKIYEDLKQIFCDNFEEKSSLTKIKHSRESYERLMTYFAFLFKKYDVIEKV